MTIVKSEDLGDVKKETINDLVWNSIKVNPQITAFSYRNEGVLHEITYSQFGEKIQSFGLGLKYLGLQKGDRVSLLADTRYEWVLADYAIMGSGGVTVTIYPTLFTQSVQHIVEDSGSKIIILENQEQLEKVMHFWDSSSPLQYVIIMEPYSHMPQAVHSLDEIMERGNEFGQKHPNLFKKSMEAVEPDDLCTLVYSSGTTGLPKGVMLSHWNWRFNIYSMFTQSNMLQYKPGDALLAFLPLAHVYMRIVQFIGTHTGATTYFSTPAELSQNLPHIRPAGFGAVPRLWERIYERIHEEVKNSRVTRRIIFYWAADIAKEMGEARGNGKIPSQGLKLKHSLANRLVFSRIRKATGLDRVQLTVSAGSALSRELAHFFNGLEINIVEGYGLTETAGPSNVNYPHRPKPGTVGPPLPGTLQKIAEDGEVLIKGDNVMQGYFNLPAETKEAFTSDGWFKTGDTGFFDEDNFLVFKERKKHLLVLSTGKNVAPQPIEDKLQESEWIEEAVVIGNDKKFVSALIQPNYKELLEFARQNNIEFNQEVTVYGQDQAGEEVPIYVDPSLLKNDKIRQLIQEEVDKANGHFNDFEQVKKFYLIENAISQDRGELTPTLKVKRNIILQNYASGVEEMYS